MAIGLVGIKRGMTRIFTEAGVSIPVTVVEVDKNCISQIKTTDNDGYSAIQITTGSGNPQIAAKKRRSIRVNAAQKGHYAKAGVEAGRGAWEFRVDESELDGRELGSHFGVDLFAEGDLVDVTGQSKGKGFQGGVKRHNFRTQDATHGNSVSHRVLGSTGQNQTPGRVFKGKKMPGQMGNKRVTVQGLEVVMVNVEKGFIAIKGAIPGANGGDVIIRPSVKA